MIKEQLEVNFAEVKDAIKENWKNLSDEDISQINGRYENFVKKLQQKYGITRLSTFFFCILSDLS